MGTGEKEASILIVDDSPENVQKLRSGGHETIVFSNSTNAGLPGPRADSWREVERIVIGEYESWRASR